MVAKQGCYRMVPAGYPILPGIFSTLKQQRQAVDMFSLVVGCALLPPQLWLGE